MAERSCRPVTTGWKRGVRDGSQTSTCCTAMESFSNTRRKRGGSVPHVPRRSPVDGAILEGQPLDIEWTRFLLDKLHAELLTEGRRPGRGNRANEGRGLSPRTVSYIAAIIHHALQDAARKGLVAATWPSLPIHPGSE
jgi:hypothetical protein